MPTVEVVGALPESRRCSFQKLDRGLRPGGLTGDGESVVGEAEEGEGEVFGRNKVKRLLDWVCGVKGGGEAGGGGTTATVIGGLAERVSSPLIPVFVGCSPGCRAIGYINRPQLGSGKRVILYCLTPTYEWGWDVWKLCNNEALDNGDDGYRNQWIRGRIKYRRR